jgi:hypothetical protein
MMTSWSVRSICTGRTASILPTLICSRTMRSSSTRLPNIWATLTAADAWPVWYSNATDVVVDDPSGQLAAHVTFNWTTFGLKIASEVAEFIPYSRISWYGYGDQLRAFHTWLLVPRSGDSTYVVMEEIGMGHGAQRLALTNPGHMHRGHDLWNISLKFVCEA